MQLDDVLAEIRRFRRDVARADEELWEAIEDLHEMVHRGLARGRGGSEVAEHEGHHLDPRLYRKLKRRLRSLVTRSVPEGARVAVVSRGDSSLLDFDEVRTEHFPRNGCGEYAGYYPGDGTASIAHLEWVRASGATHLLFPDSARWWLESFPRFAEHLESRYARSTDEPGVGVVYELEPSSSEPSWPGQLGGLLDAWEEASGATPSVLDWDTGWDLQCHLPGRSVFSPPEATERLPYLDGSVDVVALSRDDVRRRREARRVARRSLVLLPEAGSGEGGGDHEDVPESHRLPPATVEHRDGPPPRLPPVSIVIPTYDGIANVEPCVRALEATLGDGFEGEVLVVDDGSGAATAGALDDLEGRLSWLRVVRNRTNAGFIDSCNRGAEEAQGELLVFLNDDTVPLPGWLHALHRTFEGWPDAGAVGGRLVYPDGRLQEAGCVVYSDGTGANFGRGDYDVDGPLYSYVRRVDYCSGALLATPRELFRSLGGFDTRYRPAYYEDTDYCLAVRSEGLSVYYQPDATVVHTEGATSGTDLAGGAKKHQVLNQTTFARKWRSFLRERPEAPASYSSLTWYRLAMVGAP